jgi:hypothetical protein
MEYRAELGTHDHGYCKYTHSMYRVERCAKVYTRPQMANSGGTHELQLSCVISQSKAVLYEMYIRRVEQTRSCPNS